MIISAHKTIKTLIEAVDSERATDAEGYLLIMIFLDEGRW